MKRLLLLVIAPLSLAACDREPERPAKPPVGFTPPPAPAASPPTYVGRWAASPELCEDGAWVFGPNSLATAGEVSCTFSEVSATETGWIAKGACIAQAPAQPATLVLDTAELDSRRTLTVSGGPFPGPALLGACPSPEEAANAVLQASAAIDRLIRTEGEARGSAIELRRFAWDITPMQAWLQDGQVVRIAEPVMATGGSRVGERRYWFRRGETDPFLVREADTRYAFNGDGRIVSVFSREGDELQLPTAADRAVLERRLMERARTLRLAAEG